MYRGGRKKGSKNVNLSGALLLCANCGTEFYVQAYRLAKDKPRFCSMKCLWAGRKRRIHQDIKKICDNCGVSFFVPAYRKNSARFCSRRCGGKWALQNKSARWSEKIVSKIVENNKARSDTPQMRANKLAFQRQRSAASHRGIEWKFSFEEWLKVWQESGHLHERGRLRGQYQMSRNGDVGPYAPYNVRIVPISVNLAERDVRKFRGSSSGTSTLTEDVIRAIRAAEGNEPRRVTAERYGITCGHVYDIQKRRAWAWLE